MTKKIIVKIDGLDVPQFDEYDESDSWDYDGRKLWGFDCSMRSTCSPLFDDCESNYEIEEKLQQAKVILPNNDCDSESCALVVRFSTLKAANAFIKRLNAYLAEKVKRLAAARSF
jgi:hypothetical protein